MLTVNATEFVNNFGRRNQEVQREPIEVKSHGRTVGYYVSPDEYNRLERAAQRAAEPGAYNSIKPLVHARRSEIMALAKRYGIARIRLFGSVARGEDKPQSDLDFLVEYPPGHVPSFDDLGLAAEIGDLFDGRQVDVVRMDKVDKRLKDSVIAGAIEI